VINTIMALLVLSLWCGGVIIASVWWIKLALALWRVEWANLSFGFSLLLLISVACLGLYTWAKEQNKKGGKK